MIQETLQTAAANCLSKGMALLSIGSLAEWSLMGKFYDGKYIHENTKF